MVLGQKQAPARYDEETADEDNNRGSYTPDFNSRDIKPVPPSLKEELNNRVLPRLMKMRMMLSPTSRNSLRSEV